MNKKIPYVNPKSVESKRFLIRSSSFKEILPLDKEVYHRHDYQTIIWTLAGTGHHVLDDQSITTPANTLLLISRGQVHKVQALSKEGHGMVIRFKDDFLPHTIGQTWNYQATLFNNLNVKAPIVLQKADVLELKLLFEQMQVEQDRLDSFGSQDAIRHLLQILLIKIERLHQATLTQTKGNDKNYKVFQRFLTQLEEDFIHHHDVTYYADKLNMSPRQLADVCRQVCGKPLKEVIVDRLILEAKRHLQFTELSIKEIAYALGYESHFYFSQVFKRITQESPTNYRKNL